MQLVVNLMNMRMMYWKHSPRYVLPRKAIPFFQKSLMFSQFCFRLLLLIIKMRRRYSPTRSRQIQDYDYLPERAYTDHPSPRLHQDFKLFCHYNNAVYMGSMLSSEKHGKGLLLHDDGATVVTEYHHDAPSGHNVIFRDNSITSILFRTHLDYEIAYKVDRFIIKIPFSDSSHRANGSGCLIDYPNGKVFQLEFHDGAIVEKVLQLDRRTNEDIFKKKSITRSIGVKHEQAFELTFQRPEGLHVKRDLNQLTIGYYNERGDVHGLAAKMYAENVEASAHRSLCLKPIQRGYYKNSQLQTFGQKYFSNGNRYIGEFIQGQFEGNGILLCPQQMKWVYGTFIQGKLSQVIDSNNDRHTKNDYQMWVDGLWDIHKLYRDRYIDLNIELPDQLYLYRILQDALRMQVTHIDHDREEQLKEGKMRLNKIQHQFIEGYPGNVQRSYVDQELDRHYTNQYQYGKLYNSTPRSQQPITRRTPQKDYLRQYRLSDPFQEWYKPGYIRSRFQDYYPNQPFRSRYKTSTPRRRVRLYDDLPSRHDDYEPVDSIYRRTYFDSLEKHRNDLKKLQQEDVKYLDNLRYQMGKSPVHRNYLSSPKYDPDRYREKPIYKKYFNYKDPHAAYVHRWPQNLNSSRQSPKYEDYDSSPTRPSRNVPYRSPSRAETSGSTFVQNNYKHWDR